ncbi:hypothetical protein OQA88_9346 [Cercophora sp. LCS_1]
MFANVYHTESPSSPTEHAAETCKRYFQWAMELAMPEVLLSSNLEIVQVLCLMTCYLHGSSQSAQLWTLHSLSVKAATQICLHCPDASSGMTLLEREMRKRTWFWCLMNDEQVAPPPSCFRILIQYSIVSVKLGRPLAMSSSLRKNDLACVDINDVFPTVHAPASVVATSANHFTCQMQLAKFTSDVILQLYNDNSGSVENIDAVTTVKLAFDFSCKLSVSLSRGTFDHGPFPATCNPPGLRVSKLEDFKLSWGCAIMA